ncbi:MAG: hypothetical protein JKY08_02110 [Flavobacteriaceae bacterium]|nr:hypothetical protein [Flavobacteriaceae bacterium]
MKKIIIITIIILFPFISNSQSVKVKKGNILLDGQKFGSIEKIKVKGANNYLQIKDNNQNVIFNAKLIVEDSKIYGNKKKHVYFMIDCVKEKDTIGIENLGFYLGQKKVVKYLVKNKLINTEGVNNSKLNTLLANTTSKPSFVLDDFKIEDELIKNINFKVNRDTNNPVFVEKTINAKLKLKPKTSSTHLKYEILQGEDKTNRALIGYAFIEYSISSSRPYLVITNSKGSPIAYFDNINHYTLYPQEQFKFELLKMKRLDTPVEAIYQITQYLIEKEKL